MRRDQLNGATTKRDLEKQLEVTRLRCRQLITELKAEYARYDRLKAALDNHKNGEDDIPSLRAKILGVAATLRRAAMHAARWIALRRR